MLYWLGYFFFHCLRVIFFPTKVIGRKNLPTDTGFILASNHISNLDPFAVGIHLRKRVSFVAKDSLFNTPLKSWLFHGFGAFPIKRDSSDFRAIREILRRLKEKSPVVIFPEGTRIREHKKVQPGIGLVAVKGKVPVVPVYIEGTDKVLPPGRKFPSRHPVRVTFGEPIKFEKGEDYEKIAEKIMQRIKSLSE